MHKRWITVGQLKKSLSNFNDEALVFIQPHKSHTDYPFYVYSSGNDYVYFRFYNDSLLKEPLKDKIFSIYFKWRIKIWNLVNFNKKQ